jgi:hypothetical protein
MTGIVGSRWDRTSAIDWWQRLIGAARMAGPLQLFGLRVWASVPSLAAQKRGLTLVRHRASGSGRICSL